MVVLVRVFHGDFVGRSWYSRFFTEPRIRHSALVLCKMRHFLSIHCRVTISTLCIIGLYVRVTCSNLTYIKVVKLRYAAYTGMLIPGTVLALVYCNLQVIHEVTAHDVFEKYVFHKLLIRAHVYQTNKTWNCRNSGRVLTRIIQ